MSEVHLLIPKRPQTVWNPTLERLDIERTAVVEIPLLGTVTAGTPIDIYETKETVAVPAAMVRKETYALRVRGDSMIDENIQDGDIIVVNKRETAENGQSVVVMINGETTTLKRFYIEEDGIRLQPANPEMQPIYLKHEEVQILGIVACVLRLPND